MDIKKIIVFFFVLLVVTSCKNHEYVTISGEATDFNNKPLENVAVELKNSSFKTIDSAITDKRGMYSFKAKKDYYFALTAVNKQDYRKTNLEFWAWNIPADTNLNINIQYDKLEVYGVNVFLIQGAFPAYSIYLRPMSLTRVGENLQSQKFDKMAPIIDSVDLNISLDGKKLKIYSKQIVHEYARNQSMIGYFIQAEYQKPKDKHSPLEIVLFDRERKEYGAAKFYFPLSQYH